MAPALTWSRSLRALPPPRFGAARHGIGTGDTVAAMLPNIPAMYEAHFGVPMAGGVLNTLNTRLDADAIAFMLDHGEAKVLLTDREFSRDRRAGAGAGRAQAARNRRRRSARSAAASCWARSTTRSSLPAAIRSSRGSCRATSGMRSRSTTRRARPAIRKASSITTAAPI